MKLRDHCVAIAQVEHVIRTGRSGLGGEVEITGVENAKDEVVVIVPKLEKEAYLRAFLTHHYGHWGSVDGERLKLHAVTFRDLDGGVVNLTY